MKATGRVAPATLIFYALPALALGLPTIPVYVFLPTFYAETMGLGLSAVGAALLAARVADVVTDPLIGVLSDRWQGRFGRRKPWITLGFPIAALAMVFLFQPPAGIGPAYLLVVAVVLYTGWTAVAVPYSAWGAELSADYGERARITGAREGLQLVGILSATGIPLAAVALGLPETRSWAAVAWVAVAVGLPAVAVLLWRVPDPPQAKRPKTPPSRDDWLGVIRNGPFRRLLSAWFVNGFANGIPAVLFPLYLQHGLQAGATARAGLIFAYFLTGVLAIPLWVAWSRRVGKHRAWCAAMLMACAAFVWVPLIPAQGVGWFLIVCIVTGAALGADLALPPAMQADVIDLDRLRHRRQRAGLFFALWNVATKLALAGAVGFAFPLLDALGFNVDGGNDGTALLALAVIYALVPTVLKLGAVLMVWRHPITERRQRAIRRLIERHERAPADRPRATEV